MMPRTRPLEIALAGRSGSRFALAFALSLALHLAFFALLAWSMRGSAPTAQVIVPIELTLGPLLAASAPQAEQAPPREDLSRPQDSGAETLSEVGELPQRPLPRPSPPGAPDLGRETLAALDASPQPLLRPVLPTRDAPMRNGALAVRGDAALQFELLDWLRRHQRYPRAARRAGLEGTAQVRFVISRDGALRERELVASSGHDVLDRAALDLLERAAPYPSLPTRIEADNVELTLPVEYRLAWDASRG